jgi:hypothetical protein
MARIDFALDAARPAKVQDSQSDMWPDCRHAWIELKDVDGSDLALHMAHGVPTNEEIIASGLLLIAAATELVNAAQQRIRDREWIAAAKAAREPSAPSLPDGLDAATIADAMAGWTPGELQEAFGS